MFRVITQYDKLTIIFWRVMSSIYLLYRRAWYSFLCVSVGRTTMIKNDGGMAESVSHDWPLNLKAVTFSSVGDLSDCVDSVAVCAIFCERYSFVSLLAF